MSQFKFLPSAPALRVPATRRISLPASQRLSTITEGAQAQDLGRWSRLSALRNSTSSAATHRTPPPPYEWAPEPAISGGVGTSANNASEDEKLERLRRTWSGAKGQRGGWGRLLVLVVVILALLGLAIGLGVGLTVGRKRNDENEISTDNSNTTTTQPQDNPTPIQQFPLGQYSFLTTLRSQQTNCTSNSATWRCYPYTVFDSSDPSTVQSSQSTFDWIIRNDSALYATNTTTSPSSVPANLTISSTDNPFALSFTAQDLTYTYDSNDDSSTGSPKLTFSFTLPKVVVPTAALTSDNAATQCYFNNTVLSGTLHLAATAGNSLSNTTDTGSYDTWPYAAEIVQSSKGGQGTPECFEVVNGEVGDRVVQGLEPRGEEDECRCEYRNYG